MSFWEEDTEQQPIPIPGDVVDLSFRIQCQTLPVDHAWALRSAILQYLPWFPTEPLAALHQILVAESGNGWQSPEQQQALLYPSRRTRLILRLPHHRVAESRATLDGATLELAQHPITLSRPEIQPLSRHTTLYCRFALFAPDEQEESFLHRIRAELSVRQIHPRKMVCGREHRISTPDGIRVSHSLMLADLTPKEALQLQQQGLQEGKDFGCGLFLPHKTVENRLQQQE